MKTVTLVELAEIVYRATSFSSIKKTSKKLRGTAIGTKFAAPYAIFFMAHLEERILEAVELQPHIWWMYIDDTWRRFVKTIY